MEGENCISERGKFKGKATKAAVKWRTENEAQTTVSFSYPFWKVQERQETMETCYSNIEDNNCDYTGEHHHFSDQIFM